MTALSLAARSKRNQALRLAPVMVRPGVCQSSPTLFHRAMVTGLLAVKVME